MFQNREISGSLPILSRGTLNIKKQFGGTPVQRNFGEDLAKELFYNSHY